MRSREATGGWLLTARLGVVVAAWLIWAVKPDLGWSVALALAPWLVQALVAPRTLGLSDVPPLLAIAMGLFLVTAGAGLWASYDRDGTRAVFANPIGWQKLWGLLLAAVLFFALATTRMAAGRRRALALLAGLGGTVALAFVATNDWIAEPALWDPVTRLGQAIQAPLPPLPRGFLNPNVAGGVMAVLLPLALGLAAEGRPASAPPWTTWGLLTAGAMALGLFLTTSRGAWLGVGGGLALAATWWLVGRLAHGERQLAAFIGLTVALGAVGAGLVALIAPLRTAVLASSPVVNRLDIFSQAMLLVRDYPFTGSGLGTFPLIHSTYALMIHVPILSHAHALPLDVAIEQGVGGALAALIVWGGAAWIGLRALARSEGPRPTLAAALLSLAVLLIHGLTDDALYSSRGVFLIWAPVGAVMAASRGCTAGTTGGTGKVGWTWNRVGVLGMVALALLGLLALARRPLAGAWYANLGAVHQTLDELRSYDYHHFDDPSLDQIRRQEDLSMARAYFRRALALDPGQVTARARLAQIALGRGQYEAALAHAEAAWEAGHRDRVTRLLLGDALVAQGQVDRGVEVVRGLEWAKSRLDGQAFYRYWQHEDWRRAAYAWRAALALDPDDERVRQAVQRAEERASGR